MSTVSLQQSNKLNHLVAITSVWYGKKRRYEICNDEGLCATLSYALCSRVELWRENTRLHSVWREFVRSWAQQTALQSADDKQDLRVGFNFKLHVVIVLLWQSLDGILELEIEEKVITKLVEFRSLIRRPISAFLVLKFEYNVC